MRFLIITPSLNQVSRLKCCLASVADQSGAGVDVIYHHVQDGASTDGTVEFLNQVNKLGRENRYHFTFASEPDAGMYDAVNRGVRFLQNQTNCDVQSDHEVIVAWLNCDEQYLSGTLQRVAEWFKNHPEKDILFGNTVVVSSSGEPVCCRKAVLPFKWHVLTDHLSTLSASTFTRLSAITDDNTWLSTRWKNRGDSEWIVRMLDRRVPMGRSRDYFSVFCDSIDSLGLQQGSLQEQRLLSQQVPEIVRCLRPIWILFYRFRKFFSGGYRQKPFEYSIYCGTDQERTPFFIKEPQTRWKSRMGK
ncbi:MAG: glycosyltransferase [Kiritimatiellales bacterium]